MTPPHGVSRSLENVNLNSRNFDKFMKRAIKNKSYIEVISLIHNTIELYLMYSFRVYLIYKGLLQERDNSSEYLKRIKLMTGTDTGKSLIQWNDLCFMSGAINENDYDSIREFNKGRNSVMHRLLIEETIDYTAVKEIARNGMELQMKFSPIITSDLEKQRLLSAFDNPDLITEEELNPSR